MLLTLAVARFASARYGEAEAWLSLVVTNELSPAEMEVHRLVSADLAFARGDHDHAASLAEAINDQGFWPHQRERLTLLRAKGVVAK
jgi:hypothetical protein